jgi:hypothetical protein
MPPSMSRGGERINDRRSFLKSSAAAGGALLATGRVSASQPGAPRRAYGERIAF